MTDIPPKWLKFAADLLNMASEKFSNHGCNDMDWPHGWSKAERVEFLEAMERWTGTETEVEPDGLLMDWMVMAFLADMLRDATIRGADA